MDGRWCGSGSFMKNIFPHFSQNYSGTTRPIQSINNAWRFIGKSAVNISSITVKGCKY